ncbi:HEPN domain-containing protein [Clostridium frigidicarnis]|uniref:HEPN domain-containing protein n=1 Tax=Clostridium frigidicarnis TaxID=84698 RepID=A0A1I1AX14_9CLOT|nr:HEPN domain-containing protein [Clostridium frigidicarnis]SFB42604.1 HEPN domain-containing protein [Clostridium frigidicarnis]
MVTRDMFYFADVDEKFIVNTKDIESLEDGVLVHCEQCIEKNLKGIITKKYGIVNREHNLVKLLEVLYLKDYCELKAYKSLCRDLKDFYFSRRYASDDYEILEKEEYDDYLKRFFQLLSKLKEIRNSLT